MFTATASTLNDSKAPVSESYETLDGAKFWLNIQLTGHGYHGGIVRDEDGQIIARAYLTVNSDGVPFTEWQE